MQNSLSVYVGQGLQDGLPMLDQGSECRALVPIGHATALAPCLLPVTT